MPRSRRACDAMLRVFEAIMVSIDERLSLLEADYFWDGLREWVENQAELTTLVPVLLFAQAPGHPRKGGVTRLAAWDS